MDTPSKSDPNDARKPQHDAYISDPLNTSPSENTLKLWIQHLKEVFVLTQTRILGCQLVALFPPVPLKLGHEE